jgi:hypothetical protein
MQIMSIRGRVEKGPEEAREERRYEYLTKLIVCHPLCHPLSRRNKFLFGGPQVG